MERSPDRQRHLIFLAHLWLCAPFVAIWLLVPGVRRGIPPESLHRIEIFLPFVALYVAVRTWLALKDPAWLKWAFAFPPFDVAIVAALVWLGNRDPLGNVTLLYMFPLAEAAGSLSVAWAVAVAAMVLGETALATAGFQTADPFNTAFRYFFLLILTLLVTWLSRTAASLREQLGVARDRNRIAMEMHDGVQGHLVTLSSQLELLQRLAPTDPAKAAEIAAEGRECARLAADELRFLVQRLRAPALAAGFLPALKTFAQNQTSRHGLDLIFEVHGEPAPLRPESENGLFRIAQECLNNILRHAAAHTVTIAVTYGPKAVTLAVRDDGTGFDPSADPGADHSGIDGMKARAQAMNASFQIESGKGEGATVTVALPLRE